MLALEIGVAEGDDAAFVPVERRITETCTDARLFPTTARAAATLAGSRQPWTTLRLPYSRYTAYFEHLKTRSDIDEAAYLAANPDVAEAVKRGEMPGARFHYWHYGRREKRPLCPRSGSL